MIKWVVRKFRAVVTLYNDTRRDLRDRYSNLYPHGMLRRIIRRFPAFSGVEVFIETGTFQGKTTRQESRYFRDVHTIELNEELFHSNASVFERYPNIHAYLGDCVETLPRILLQLDEPCVFFLDAHWSGDHTVDWGSSEWKGFEVKTSYRGDQCGRPEPEQQCPLVEEAKIINTHPHKCILIIDDWDVAGTRDLKFKGEDWSSITLDRILGAFDRNRVVSHFIMKYKEKKRLIVLLADLLCDS